MARERFWFGVQVLSQWSHPRGLGEVASSPIIILSHFYSRTPPSQTPSNMGETVCLTLALRCGKSGATHAFPCMQGFRLNPFSEFSEGPSGDGWHKQPLGFWMARVRQGKYQVVARRRRAQARASDRRPPPRPYKIPGLITPLTGVTGPRWG